MTRHQALRIHAFHDASGSICLVMASAVALLSIVGGYGPVDTLAIGAGALAFSTLIAAVSTDMMSKRIPNTLSVALLSAALLWWLAALFGSPIPDAAGTGIARDIIGMVTLDPIGGPVIGDLPTQYPLRIVMDMAIMVIVFVPLYLSFRFGLGFGGGDVKLITAGSLFFGWPLGFDFLILSFLIGGGFSIFIIMGRIVSRIAVSWNATTAWVVALSEMREFPYAPAIALSAILCFSIKFQGMF